MLHKIDAGPMWLPENADQALGAICALEQLARIVQSLSNAGALSPGAPQGSLYLLCTQLGEAYATMVRDAGREANGQDT